MFILGRFFPKYLKKSESVKSKNSFAWRKRGESGEVGRVVLACKSDEEKRKAARAAAFPYSLLTDRRCFCSCDYVGIRSEHTDPASGSSDWVLLRLARSTPRPPRHQDQPSPVLLVRPHRASIEKHRRILPPYPERFQS